MPRTNGDLTPKQRAFVKEYAKTQDGKGSAIKAGYSPHTAKNTASKLLKHPAIQSYLKKGFQKVTKTRAKHDPDISDITPAYILNKIREVANKTKARDQDRLKALELLGKYQALFTEKVRHEVPEPIVLKDDTGSQILKLGMSSAHNNSA